MPTPYEVICSECNALLTVMHRHLNDEGDLIIEILPCSTCLQDARIEAEGRFWRIFKGAGNHV